MLSPLEQRALERGIRLSGQRRVIARVLSGAGDHPDAEELYRRASGIDGQISLATVYRTLRLFEEAGLIARHDAGDGRARYGGDDHRPGWPPRACDADPFAPQPVAGLRRFAPPYSPTPVDAAQATGGDDAPRS